MRTHKIVKHVAVAESLAAYADAFWNQYSHSVARDSDFFQGKRRETKIMTLIKQVSQVSTGIDRETLLDSYDPDYPHQSAEEQTRTRFSFDKMIQRAKRYAVRHGLSIQECAVEKKFYVSAQQFPRALKGVEINHILPTLMEHYKALKALPHAEQMGVFDFMQSIAVQVASRKGKVRHNLLAQFLDLVSGHGEGVPRTRLIKGLYPAYERVSYTQKISIDKCLNRLTRRLRQELSPFQLDVCYIPCKGNYSLTLR